MKKKDIGEKPHFKKNTRSCPDHLLGHGSTRRVDRVLPGCCTGWSFNKIEPIQLPS
jgi:hypothetical protein